MPITPATLTKGTFLGSDSTPKLNPDVIKATFLAQLDQIRQDVESDALRITNWHYALFHPSAEEVAAGYTLHSFDLLVFYESPTATPHTP